MRDPQMTRIKNNIITIVGWSIVSVLAALAIVGLATGAWGITVFCGAAFAVTLRVTKSMKQDDAIERSVQKMLPRSRSRA